MALSAFAEKHPWTNSWWKPAPDNRGTLVYIVSIHILAVLGLILFPIPSLKVFLISVGFATLGSLGTTLAYHRALAHRAVKLHPVLEQILIFWAMFNVSGTPSIWVANHRNHHANADTIDDVSSPRHGGFWWAHLRWVYQWPASSMEKWCPDMMKRKYLCWATLQPYIIIFSVIVGYFIAGWVGFFWIGAIRLVYILHGQMVVNSLLHLQPGLPAGADSSRNIWWVGPFQLAAWGENYHRNHHASPSSARFARHFWQVDIAWYCIWIFKRLGLATNVRINQRV